MFYIKGIFRGVAIYWNGVGWTSDFDTAEPFPSHLSATSAMDVLTARAYEPGDLGLSVITELPPRTAGGDRCKKDGDA